AALVVPLGVEVPAVERVVAVASTLWPPASARRPQPGLPGHVVEVVEAAGPHDRVRQPVELGDAVNEVDGEAARVSPGHGLVERLHHADAAHHVGERVRRVVDVRLSAPELAPARVRSGALVLLAQPAEQLVDGERTGAGQQVAEEALAPADGLLDERADGVEDDLGCLGQPAARPLDDVASRVPYSIGDPAPGTLDVFPAVAEPAADATVRRVARREL